MYQVVYNGMTVQSESPISTDAVGLAATIYKYMGAQNLTEIYVADLARNSTGIFPPDVKSMARRSRVQRLSEHGVSVEGMRFYWTTSVPAHYREKTQRLSLKYVGVAADAQPMPSVRPYVAAPPSVATVPAASTANVPAVFAPAATMSGALTAADLEAVLKRLLPQAAALAETPAQPGKPNPYVPADRRRPAPLDEIDGEEYAYRLEILRDTFRAEFEDWKDWSSQILKHAWSYEDEAKKRVAAGEVQVAEIKAALLKWREDALLARQVTLDMLKEQTVRQVEALEQKVAALEKRLDELDPDALNRLMEG